jgi:hypothetical protein
MSRITGCGSARHQERVEKRRMRDASETVSRLMPSAAMDTRSGSGCGYNYGLSGHPPGTYRFRLRYENPALSAGSFRAYLERGYSVGGNEE